MSVLSPSFHPYSHNLNLASEFLRLVILTQCPHCSLGIYWNSTVILWFPIVGRQDSRDGSASFSPLQPCLSLLLSSQSLSHQTGDLRLTRGFRLSDLGPHHMCSFPSLGTSPFSLLDVNFYLKFTLLTWLSHCWLGSALDTPAWFLDVLYHVTLCVTALSIILPFDKAVNFMKTSTTSARVLSCSPRCMVGT